MNDNTPALTQTYIPTLMELAINGVHVKGDAPISALCEVIAPSITLVDVYKFKGQLFQVAGNTVQPYCQHP